MRNFLLSICCLAYVPVNGQSTSLTDQPTKRLTIGIEAVDFHAKSSGYNSTDVNDLSTSTVPFKIQSSFDRSPVLATGAQLGLYGSLLSSANDHKEWAFSLNMLFQRQFIYSDGKMEYLGRDSTNTGYLYHRSFEQLFLRSVWLSASVANTYHTDRKRKLSVHGGYGLSLGTTIVNEFELEEFHSNVSLDYYDTNFRATIPYGPSLHSYRHKVRAKSGYYLRPFLPLGLDLRLSKSDRMWGKLYLSLIGNLGWDIRFMGSRQEARFYHSEGLRLSYRL